jgi:hypothetical protein
MAQHKNRRHKMTGFTRSLKRLAMCLAAFFCACLGAQESRPLVAILEPVGTSAITQINKMSALGALEGRILQSGKYRIVDRQRTDQIFKEHEFARSAVVDVNGAKEIGKILQADIVCATNLVKEGGEFYARSALIDVVSGEVFASADEFIAADTSQAIRTSMEKVASKLIGFNAANSDAPPVGAQYNEFVGIWKSAKAGYKQLFNYYIEFYPDGVALVRSFNTEKGSELLFWNATAA